MDSYHGAGLFNIPRQCLVWNPRANKLVYIRQGEKMTITEMAKAHLQNVHNKLNELQENKKILEQEIEKLSNYIKSGLELIQKEEEVSNQ
jgi:uncharacterized membrane protein YgaE (UPF0421/DUF939 family)